MHPELLPGAVRQAEFWAEVGRALLAGKKTRETRPVCPGNCHRPGRRARRDADGDLRS
ncbi:MAG TPA: hypothetical protein VIY28_14575 [Pseudonocardiaceae bacterium]